MDGLEAVTNQISRRIEELEESLSFLADFAGESAVPYIESDFASKLEEIAKRLRAGEFRGTEEELFEA